MAGWLSAMLPELAFGLGAGLTAGLMAVLLLVAAGRRVEGRPVDGARSAVLSGAGVGVSLSLCLGGLLAAYFSPPSVPGGNPQDALHAAGPAVESAAGLAAVAAALLVAGILSSRQLGRGALFAGALLSVAQIGIPSAGWIWRSLGLAGRNAAPLTGALAGVMLAVLFCWRAALWLEARQISANRKSVRWPMVLLAVGTALQLGAGLAALQQAGWIPGAHQPGSSPGGWWRGLLAGVMGPTREISTVQLWTTVLAAAAAAGFWVWKRRPGRTKPAGSQEKRAQPQPGPARPGRIWRGVAVAAPLMLAIPIVLSVQPSSTPSAAAAADKGTADPVTAVTATEKSCAPESTSLPTGRRSFSISNTSRWPLEIYLVRQPDGGVLARTGIVGPGTVGLLAAVLGPGDYALQCLQSGQPVARSKAFTASGATPGNATPAIPATSTGDLLPATNLYSKYVQATLTTLDGQVEELLAALAGGDLDASRRDWLEAQQTWQSMGAAYGSFGDLGEAVNALPHGSAAPDRDPAFTGLHRIEYGLYHGQAPASLVPVVQTLQDDLAKLRNQLPSLVLIPANMPLRAHEILEDALRDHLSGQDDQGSGMAYALTAADVLGTRAVVDRLAAVLEARRPGLVQHIGAALDAADEALQATQKDGQWVRFQEVPRGQQQSVNAAVSAALETLAQVPQLLQLAAGSE